MIRKSIVVAAALCIVAITSFAQAPAGDSAGKGRARPCRADAQRLCAGIKPGEGRIVACLKSHESDLSAACKANLANLRSRERDGGKK